MSLLHDKLAEANIDPRAVLIGDVTTCNGCGCDDNHACIDARGRPCSWFVLDIATATGLCTACAAREGFDQPFVCDAPIVEDQAA